MNLCAMPCIDVFAMQDGQLAGQLCSCIDPYDARVDKKLQFSTINHFSASLIHCLALKYFQEVQLHHSKFHLVQFKGAREKMRPTSFTFSWPCDPQRRSRSLKVASKGRVNSACKHGRFEKLERTSNKDFSSKDDPAGYPPHWPDTLLNA